MKNNIFTTDRPPCVVGTPLPPLVTEVIYIYGIQILVYCLHRRRGSRWDRMVADFNSSCGYPSLTALPSPRLVPRPLRLQFLDYTFIPSSILPLFDEFFGAHVFLTSRLLFLPPLPSLFSLPSNPLPILIHSFFSIHFAIIDLFRLS